MRDDKKIRMLMTLEEVGCTGKFFTDGVVIKCCGVMIAAVVLVLFIAGQISFILPTWLGFVIGCLIILPIAFNILSITVLKRKDLCRIFSELDESDIIDCRKYSDIYRIDSDNICYHSTGHRSIMVSVDRLHTIGMKEKDVLKYYSAIESFESALLSSVNKFSFKYYEIEDVDKFRGAINYQNKLISSIDNNNVNITTKLKNKFRHKFINEFGKDYTIVYVIYLKYGAHKSFRKQVESCMSHLDDKHIGNVHIMNEQEINEFGEKYFNTKFFDCINIGESLTEDLIKFEEEVL